MTTPYNNDLTVLVNCIASTFGDEVGQAVQDKFDQIFALESADINAISAQIAQLNTLLTSNTEGDVLTAQSILSQLAALDARIDVLESSTGVADLATVVATLQAALGTEATDRAAADANFQASIDGIETALSQMSAQLVSIQNTAGSGDPACDCVAINTAIAEQAVALANLQASDAGQATQIAALQTALVALQGNSANVAAAQAAADAAQATAQTALAAAAAAAASASAAAANVATLTATVAALDAANEVAHNTYITKEEITNINCALVGANFRASMRGRMFALGDPRRV